MVWHEAEFNRVFRSWNGMTGDYIRKRSRRLETLARSGVGVRSGALKASIDSRYGRQGGELRVKVGANPHLPDSMRTRGYGYFHHEGTLPHKITAKNAKALKFRMAGRTVYRRSVNHPGTKPNPYLTRYLKEVIR